MQLSCNSVNKKIICIVLYSYSFLRKILLKLLINNSCRCKNKKTINKTIIILRILFNSELILNNLIIVIIPIVIKANRVDFLANMFFNIM